MKSLNKATISAVLAAILFALCIPCSKILAQHISSIALGGLLYLGAGLGLLITMLIKGSKPELLPTKKELPYIIAMVLLDILAVIFLMFGVSITNASSASLLGNFELVATTLCAFFIFREKVSKKLFVSIGLITLASIILSFDGHENFKFDLGSVFVLLSAICWGVENNCTKMLSIKDVRLITVIKGIFAGLFGLLLAFLFKENLSYTKWITLALILGFFSYGVSVSLYIYAQRFLGAAKTGSIYSLSPFFAVIFSLIFLSEKPNLQFYPALVIMILASILIAKDNNKDNKGEN